MDFSSGSEVMEVKSTGDLNVIVPYPLREIMRFSTPEEERMVSNGGIVEYSSSGGGGGGFCIRIGAADSSSLCSASFRKILQSDPNQLGTYSKLLVEVTLGGVAIPGVPVRELCPEPSR
jgi:hypothetical protein